MISNFVSNFYHGLGLALSGSIVAPAFAAVFATPATAEKAISEASSSEDTAVRPFTAHVPKKAVADMRRRLASTRWPDAETVTDRSQGARLTDLQKLVRHWATDYDWRRAEAKLNAYPQYRTNIDGVDIQPVRPWVPPSEWTID